MYGNSRGHESGLDINIPEQNVELTLSQRKEMRASLHRVRQMVESLLPSEYDVAVNVTEDQTGVDYGVAVVPPIGYPMSLQLNLEDMAAQTGDGLEIDDEGVQFDEEECEEVARTLAASTVLHVQQAEEKKDDDSSTYPAS